MITWKKESDLLLKFNFSSPDDNQIDPLEKSFDIKFYTTNKNIAKIASYNVIDNTFINCRLDEDNKIEVFFSKPNFNVGRLMINIRFRDSNRLFEDGYFDVWKEIKTDIEIIK